MLYLEKFDALRARCGAQKLQVDHWRLSGSPHSECGDENTVSHLLASSKSPVAFGVAANRKATGLAKSAVPTGPPTGRLFIALIAAAGAEPRPCRRIRTYV